MRDYDLLLHGVDLAHQMQIQERKQTQTRITALRIETNMQKGQTLNSIPPRREPSEEKSLYDPNSKSERKKSRGVVVGGYFVGVASSGASEGVPGVGMAKTVDVGVKKSLVRAHVVALQDDCKSLVGLVKAKVTPVVTDRISRCRKGVTRAARVTG
jgi:hypothetical protein